jgi:hypothetical protein
MRSCCPTRIGLGGVDKPEIRDAQVGAEGFYRTFLRDGFSRRRKISLLHENAGWAGVLECWEYHEIVLHEKIVLHVFSRLEGKTRLSLRAME